MNAFQWWRSWHGAPMDHKWPVIATKAGVKVGIVSAIAWALMDYASQQANRGDIAGFDRETYAVYSGFSEEEINAVIQAMNDKKVIVDGRWANWDKRQPKSEESNERVRQWRLKQRLSKDGNELKQNVTESNTEGDREEESDKDTDTEENAHISSADPFDDFLSLIRANGINPSTQADVLEITKMLNAGANLEDLKNGIAWKIGNNDGKAIFYVSQLTGPTLTEMKKRLQKANGGRNEPARPKQRIVVDPDGKQHLEPIPEGEQE